MADITSSTYPVVDDSKGSDLYAIVRDGRLKKQRVSALKAETTSASVEALRIGGTTAARPANPAPYTMYFDETLNQPIWWNGLEWVDATGVAV